MLGIDQAGTEDIEQVAALFDLYRQFYGQAPDLGGARGFVRERLSRGDSAIFLAREDERALGFAQLYPSFSSIAMRRLWILNDLFVHPDARRRAVGRRLLDRALEHARETGARGLTLKTAHDNASARALYEATGWKRDLRYQSYDLKLD